MDFKLEKKLHISGDTLKIMAALSMLIDHIAAALLRAALNGGMFTGEKYGILLNLYYAMREIGRAAFPIFAFLLVEGFFHTRSRKNYLFRLGVFFFLSELPFDLAFYGGVYWQKQNVYLTLFLGFFIICIWEKAKMEGSGVTLRKGCCAIAIMACCIAAGMLHGDYGIYGVLLIMVFYEGRSKEMGTEKSVAGFIRLFTCTLGYLLFMWEPWSIIGFVLICFYDGTRNQKGIVWKYFFYTFYPVHLLVLGIIRVAFSG